MATERLSRPGVAAALEEGIRERRSIFICRTCAESAKNST
jgi:hypothetical protein